MHYLYRITNQVNQKVYIGQTKNLSKRQHEHKKCSTNKHLRAAIAKYGWEVFSFEAIACCKTGEDADIIEKQLIIEYDSRNPDKGYNVSPGGYYTELSDEARLKLSAAANTKTNIERLKAISAARIGTTLSEEHKAKIGLAGLGRIKSPETRQLMSKLLTGRIMDEEWRAKMSVAKLGKPPNRKRVLTAQQVEQLKTDGRAAHIIGEEFGVSRITINKYRKELGLKTSQGRDHLTQEQMRQIAISPLGAAALSKELGISRTTIQKRRKQMGIK